MKGISFSEPMMLAWLAGKKTVTRRLMNPQPDFSLNGSIWYPRPDVKKAFHYANENHFRKGVAKDFARYRPGETVYIKEVWAAPIDDPDTKEIGLISYPASEALLKGHWKIKSPMFMPEWASRSHALIESVRPERIQEITEEEAAKEGFERKLIPDGGSWGIYLVTALEQFEELWETLHPESWSKNDWVWRYELEKVD